MTESAEHTWVIQLLKTRIFQRLPGAAIAKFIDCVELYPVKKGNTVIKQGDKGEYYYLIWEGQYGVLRYNKTTGTNQKIAELAEWEGFGEEAAASSETCNASVIAITDGVLMRLPRREFIDILLKPVIYRIAYQQAQVMVYQDNSVLLDVRTANEYQQCHLDGSINFPLANLRISVKLLNKNTRYIVLCDTGQRAVAGAFLLCERDFDAAVLKENLIDLDIVARTQQHVNFQDELPLYESQLYLNKTTSKQSNASTSHPNIDAARIEADIIIKQAKMEATKLKQSAMEKALHIIKNIEKEQGRLNDLKTATKLAQKMADAEQKKAVHKMKSFARLKHLQGDANNISVSEIQQHLDLINASKDSGNQRKTSVSDKVRANNAGEPFVRIEEDINTLVETLDDVDNA